jgi:GTPase
VGVDVTTRANMGSRLFGIEASMAELGRLAETAGMDVVGVVTQQLAQPYNGTYVGTGKVGEIRSEMEAVGCKTCIFDDELSPAQQRTLEKAFGGEAKGIKVLDRTALILDIFGQHAASREGQLQVELAMYQYRLPRLTRMWTHLERQGGGSGGVGLRGPGETQLESDRRMISARIVKLKRDIDAVRKHRTRQRSARRSNVGLPVVALVGYTNAGKSTVLNSLTGANVLEADALFATLDPTTRRAKMEGLKLSPEILLTDTVGFVQNLPTQLVAAFRATLEEVTEADVLVHVVDSSLAWELMRSQITAVDNVLKQIGAEGKPTIVALNKVDLFESQRAVQDKQRRSSAVEGGDQAPPLPTLERLVEEVSEFTGYDCVGISARTGAGCEEVGVLLEEVLQNVLIPVEAVVPYSRGELVAAVHEQGSCEFEDFTAGGTHIVGRAPPNLVSRLREFAVAHPPGGGVAGTASYEGSVVSAGGAESDGDDAIDWTSLAKGRH